MEHTELPWELWARYVKGIGTNLALDPKQDVLVIGSNAIGDIVLMSNTLPVDIQKANAEFIVLACNAHNDLTQQRHDLLTVCTKAHDALLALHVCDQDRSFADEIRTLLRDAIASAQP